MQCPCLTLSGGETLRLMQSRYANKKISQKIYARDSQKNCAKQGS